MKYILDTKTQGKEVDIAEIIVVSSLDDAIGFTLDESFDPLALPASRFTDPGTYNDRLIQAALDVRTNLVVIEDNTWTFYRVQEQKKAGRLYPGIGCGLIIPYESEDNVVMTLRAGTSNNRVGLWGLPGGTKELLEDIKATVAKEGKEETCLDLEVEGCIRIDEDLPPNQDWMSFLYVTKVVGGKLKNGEPHKFKDVRAHKLDMLPENTSTLSRSCVETYKQWLQGPREFIPIHTTRGA